MLVECGFGCAGMELVGRATRCRCSQHHEPCQTCSLKTLHQIVHKHIRWHWKLSGVALSRQSLRACWVCVSSCARGCCLYQYFGDGRQPERIEVTYHTTVELSGFLWRWMLAERGHTATASMYAAALVKGSQL